MRPLLLLALVLTTPAAQALTITPNPLVFLAGVQPAIVSGNAELVDVTVGVPSGGVVLEGTVAPTASTLVFRVRLDSSSAQTGPVGLFLAWSLPLSLFADALGGGWIPGAGKDVVSVLRTRTMESLHFVFADGGLTGGEEGDLFFASFSELAVGQAVGLVVRPALSGAAAETFTAEVVPEPSVRSLALAALGMSLHRLGRWRNRGSGRPTRMSPPPSSE
jgi:hypothetical protein